MSECESFLRSWIQEELSLSYYVARDRGREGEREREREGESQREREREREGERKRESAKPFMPAHWVRDFLSFYLTTAES